MALTAVGTPTTGVASDATSAVVTKVTAAAEGDILCVVLSAGVNMTFSGPDGTWDERFDEAQPGNTGASAVYLHEVGASDPSTYTFAGSVSDSCVWTCTCFRGAKLGDLVDVEASVGKSTSTGIVCNSATTTVANTLILRIGAVDGNRTFTVDGGTTELAQVATSTGSDCSAVIAYEMQASAGSTGTATHTFSGSDQWTSYTIALKPGTNADIDVPAASIAMAASVPTAGGGAAVTVPLSTISLDALAPQVPTTSQVPAGNITLAALAPTIVTGGEVISVPAASITLDAIQPSIAAGASITVPVTDITFAARAPFVETLSEIYVPPSSIAMAALVPAVFVGDVYIKSYKQLIAAVVPTRLEVPPASIFAYIDRGLLVYPTIVWEKHPSEKPRYGIDWSQYVNEWSVTVGDSQWLNVTPGGGNITFSQSSASTTQTDTILNGGADGATEYIENRVTFSDGTSRHFSVQVNITDKIPTN